VKTFKFQFGYEYPAREANIDPLARGCDAALAAERRPRIGTLENWFRFSFFYFLSGQG